MSDKINRTSKKGSYLEYIKNKAEEIKDKPEIVIPHTPKEIGPRWAYSLKEGGQRYAVKMPVTKEQIVKVKNELSRSANWKFYNVSPYGGARAYTLVTCFPPFDPIRVAEVFLPTGEVWRSTTRKFHSE